MLLKLSFSLSKIECVRIKAFSGSLTRSKGDRFMNLKHLDQLRNQIASTENLNSLRQELLVEFDRIIHFIKVQLEKDVEVLGKDLQALKNAPLKDPKALEIIGHLIMDFGDLRKDLETEI